MDRTRSVFTVAAHEYCCGIEQRRGFCFSSLLLCSPSLDQLSLASGAVSYTVSCVLKVSFSRQTETET